MIYDSEEEMPKMFGAASFVLAVALHLLIALVLWCVGFFKAPDDKEIVIPIDLTVVVHENLDGAEDEPPPVTPPEPIVEPPVEPIAEPPKDAEEPKVEPDVKPAEAVVIEKKDPKPPKEEKPKPDKKPPPPPKKDKPKITREERIAQMRNSTQAVKTPPKPRNNGRTEMRPKDWEKLLNAGYRPSSVNQGLDASEAARCHALIRKAFYDKWESPAWTSELKKAMLEVRFGRNGEVLAYKLVGSFGDPSADKTVLRAAASVKRVRGLTPEFLSGNSVVNVRFEVTPEL